MPVVRYQLRPAVAADYDFIYRLNKECFREFVTQIWGWDESLQADLFRKGFHPELTDIIACDSHDVGFFSVERRTDEIFLRSIVITADYQGQGIGGSLVRTLIGEATAAHFPITLQVLKPNPVTPFYEHFGFRITGQTETHFLMKWTPPAYMLS